MLRIVEPNALDVMQEEDRFKKRVFAANYALGTPLIKSMRVAGFETPSKVSALKLLADEYVKEQINLNYEVLRNNLLTSREHIIAQLDEAIELAHNLEEMPSLIAGIVAKAKILGLLSPEQAKNMPSKIQVQWGDENTETIYEKTNPLLYEALDQVTERPQQAPSDQQLAEKYRVD